MLIQLKVVLCCIWNRNQFSFLIREKTFSSENEVGEEKKKKERNHFLVSNGGIQPAKTFRKTV